MSGEERIARLQGVRRHEKQAAAMRLQEATAQLSGARQAADVERSRCEEAQRIASLAASTPQPVTEWLQQRVLVADLLEHERLADLQVRRLGRQEALRRVDLRAALVREEQMRVLRERLGARRQGDELRREQRRLDDLRREGGASR